MKLGHVGHSVLQALAIGTGWLAEHTSSSPWAHTAWAPAVIVGFSWLAHALRELEGQDDGRR